MQLINAIIRPNKASDVKEALQELGMPGLTLREVRGHGKRTGHAVVYRGQEYQARLLPKMELEVVVPDALVDDAVHAIMGAARTGEIGDGRVFITPILESYRIRTGERED